LISITAWIDL